MRNNQLIINGVNISQATFNKVAGSKKATTLIVLKLELLQRIKNLISIK